MIESYIYVYVLFCVHSVCPCMFQGRLLDKLSGYLPDGMRVGAG